MLLRADRTGLSRPSTLIVTLQNTLCLQTDEFFSGTDDDVVKKLNTDDASDLDEPFGHLDILPRWMRVTARMLMTDDE